MFRSVASRWRKLLFLPRPSQFQRDLQQEMLLHVELRARQLREQGIESREADQIARREFGNLTLLREKSRDVWIWQWLETAWQDLRLGARQLAKSPGFATVAILTLALGIGANTAIFSLLNAVLLRTLPVPHPEELVLFGSARADGSTEDVPDGSTTLFSYPFLGEFRRSNHVFSDVAAVFSILFGAYGRINGGSAMEKLSVELVSGTYFTTLGVSPIQGRLFDADDDQMPGAHPFAIASYSWWQRRFSMNASAVGAKVAIGSTVYTILGVAPPRFFGLTVGQAPDLWVPLAMEKDISPGWNGLPDTMFQSLHLIARRKPGVSEQQAQAETNLLFRRILSDCVAARPASWKLEAIQRAHIDLTPAATGRSSLRAQFALPLHVLMGIVALVLLIACANVANLLLARGTAREREIAVRMSIGAGRVRLIRQLLIESGLLGLIGALVGVALAWIATRLLMAIASQGSDRFQISVTPDLAVLAFTFAVAIVTILLFGAAPAFFATSLELAPALKASRGIAAAAQRSLLSRGLVAGQVALSLVLLTGAGLFLRSLTNLMNIDTGFDTRSVLLLAFDPASAGYKLDARLQSVMARMEERVGSLPGVHGASFALSVFDGGGWTDAVTVLGLPPSTRDVVHNVVGSHYLDIMKMPVVLGRALAPGDTAASRKVAVINETMARTYFPGISPLGRTFTVSAGIGSEAEWQNLEVVGVVKDAKYFNLQEEQNAAAFYPHSQHLPLILNRFVARYSGDLRSIIPSIRRAVAEIDPNLPVAETQTLTEHIDNAVLNRRLVAQLSTFFGGLAAFLACIGIYGVMSYGVARRTNEFGIRMALGAERGQVLWIVLGEAFWLGLAGVAIGLALALASGRLVTSLLVGLKPYDPLSIGMAMAAMISVALFAGYLPARRATRIDPMAALRDE
jgi:predicted permease